MTTDKTNTLYASVRDHVGNPEVSALLTESEMIPISGPGAPICPPTYASSDNSTKAPSFAKSDGVPVPEKTENGWYQGLQREPGNQNANVIRRATQVIIDAVGSQSGRAETALLKSGVLGEKAPGIYVIGDGKTNANGRDEVVESDVSTLPAQYRDALSHVISTWDASHRQADAWIKFAQTPDGKQVWEGGALGDGTVVKDLIISANANNGELLYSLLPNSAIYGFWLSSGTAHRHKFPRAYSSEVVGYGAQGIQSAATMTSPGGGASRASKVRVVNHKLVVDAKGSKPSDAGFGPVPNSPMVHAFSCELILQRASISLATLRQIKFESPEAKNAALTVLVLLAMLGHLLASQDGFYRSGCALSVTGSKWGWRHQGRGPADIEELQVSGVEQVRHALKEAILAAKSEGLSFREPIELTFSEAQKTLIEHRVENEDTKHQSERGDDV